VSIWNLTHTHPSFYNPPPPLVYAAASVATSATVGATAAAVSAAAVVLPLSLTPPQLPFPLLSLQLSGWMLSAPTAASVSVCRCHSCLPLLLPPLLSADVIVNVAPTATAAPVTSAVIDAIAAYFSAAVTTASMFQRFQLPLCFNVSAPAAAAASVPIAIATIVSAKSLSLTKSASLQVIRH